jgi:DNA polymerase-3 subunit delta'
LCPTPDPAGFGCGACEACRLFESDAHPDYRLLEPASGESDEEAGEAAATATTASRFIVINQVRGLSGFLAVSAHLAGQKVVVIQPADKLHPSAANALLKTLEEPPPRTIFVLVADEAQRLVPTVRSRCFRLGFSLPDRQAALHWLRDAGVGSAEVALAQAGGAPLAAAELQNSDFWLVRQAFLEALGKVDAQFGEILARAPTDHLSLLLGQLYRWCYDLVCLRIAGQVRYNPDHAKPLAELAVRADMRKMMGFIKELLAALRSQEHPLNSRLVVERLTVGYIRATAGSAP